MTTKRSWRLGILGISALTVLVSILAIVCIALVAPAMPNIPWGVVMQISSFIGGLASWAFIIVALYRLVVTAYGRLK
jgi:hypothetical protein